MRNSPLEKWARDTMMANGDSIQNLACCLAGLCRGERPSPQIATKKSLVENLGWPVPASLPIGFLRLALRGRRKLISTEIEPAHLQDVISRSKIEERIDQWDRIFTKHSFPKQKQSS